MTTAEIASIQRGIIFLKAKWSGSAKWAYKHLADFLAEHQISSDHLTCIDLDREPGIYDLPEFSGKIHGNGETAVVRDGRIVFITSLGKDRSQIQERCTELLKFYEG